MKIRSEEELATVLVVDDKPSNIRFLVEALKDTGYRTLVAMDGERALEQVRLAGVDLILLDVMMPGMDGFEVCRRLKAERETRGIPVIFMTALHEGADKVRGFEAGGADYLTKPLAPEEVLVRVEAHLVRRRLWREVERVGEVLLGLGEADGQPEVWEALGGLQASFPGLEGVEVWQVEGETARRVFSRGGCGEEAGVRERVCGCAGGGEAEGWGRRMVCPVGPQGERFGAMVLWFGSEGVRAREGTGRWMRIVGVSLGSALRRAGEVERLRALSGRLQAENAGWREASRGGEGAGEIVGESAVVRRAVQQVDLVAGTEATVLLEGESGTGKELFAQRVHERSGRRERAMVRVNCAAVPKELFESEFFGHVRGAFTGAARDRAGRFELADGGTLFLDEVGEIPLDLQGKLLRVLQEGTFERVGEEKTRRVDVRVVAATNRNLLGEVQAGRFREDLYYRLSVFPVRLPALRERKEDLRLLVPVLLERAARRMGLGLPAVDPEAVAGLAAYDWPGNIRELQNELERALILSQGGGLRLQAPGGAVSGGQGTAGAGAEAGALSGGRVLTEAEWEGLLQENMRRALTLSGGRVDGPGGAAERLGLRPTTLRSRMKKYNL